MLVLILISLYLITAITMFLFGLVYKDSLDYFKAEKRFKKFKKEKPYPILSDMPFPHYVTAQCEGSECRERINVNVHDENDRYCKKHKIIHPNKIDIGHIDLNRYLKVGNHRRRKHE